MPAMGCAAISFQVQRHFCDLLVLKAKRGAPNIDCNLLKAFTNRFIIHPLVQTNINPDVSGSVAIVRGSDCDFSVIATNVQAAGETPTLSLLSSF